MPVSVFVHGREGTGDTTAGELFCERGPPHLPRSVRPPATRLSVEHNLSLRQELYALATLGSRRWATACGVTANLRRRWCGGGGAQAGANVVCVPHVVGVRGFPWGDASHGHLHRA